MAGKHQLCLKTAEKENREDEHEIHTQHFFFVILLLAQVLVFNRVRIFRCATPLLYVYFVLPIPHDQPRWATLLWCFALRTERRCVLRHARCGCRLNDTHRTPAAIPALPLPLATAPTGLYRHSPHSAVGKYIVYTSVISCILPHVLRARAFNFYNIIQWAASVGGCTVLTLLLILVIENPQKTEMSDFNLEKRRYVIGGMAVTIVIVYIIRLFMLQLMSDDYKKMPTVTPSSKNRIPPHAARDNRP